MESYGEKQGIFPSTSKIYYSVSFQIKWTIRGKDITISIPPIERNNYISVALANQLAIPNSIINGRLDFWNTKEYEISNLQLNIRDYIGVSQFMVKSLQSSDNDIILGLPWIETLGTFILNAENKFLTFPYKKKKITLQDINMMSESKLVSFEDYREISRVMS